MRVLSTSFRNSLEARFNDELILVFAVITHPVLTEPIRVVVEDINGISYGPNAEPINYNLDGHMHYAIPFTFQLLTDDEQRPRTELSIMAIDKRIPEAILAIPDSPSFAFSVYKSSDWGDVLDANNARSPLATPHREYYASYLELQNVQGDELQVTADVVGLDVSNEPCPPIRTTQDKTPGLYR